jgi:hypothetical protein
MVVQSKDPMVEGVKRILELPAAANAADLETLFLAELRSRRERLACWMELIEDEVRREGAVPRSRPNVRHQCRNRATRVS